MASLRRGRASTFPATLLFCLPSEADLSHHRTKLSRPKEAAITTPFRFRPSVAFIALNLTVQVGDRRVATRTIFSFSVPRRRSAAPSSSSATMASARKRPRVEPEDNRAECPFSIKIVDPKDKDQKKKKRRRTEGGEEDDSAQRHQYAALPFAPSGKFKTYETLDLHYQVEPAKKWTDMTRYNSFVCVSLPRCLLAAPEARSLLLTINPPDDSERREVLQRGLHLRRKRL